MVELCIDKTWDGGEAGASEAATVRLTGRAEGLELDVDAPFYGDPRPPGAARSTWELWEHEVVEVFVLGPAEHYTEVELGPHGHYLVLRCQGRRNIVERELPLDFRPRIDSGRWRARVVVPWNALPTGPFRVNAYAIHGAGDGRRFLAFRPVPGEGPDFHRLEFFLPVALRSL